MPKSRDRDGELAGYDVPPQYDLRVTGPDGEHLDLLLDWSQGGWGRQSDKSSLPGNNSQPTSDSGEFYDIRDTNDYYRIVQSDWVGGAGQGSRDETGSSADRFDDSRNIDTMTPGQVELGPSTLSYTTDPGQIGAVCFAGQLEKTTKEHLVVAAFDTHPVVRSSADNVTWHGWHVSGTTPDSEPVDFADDGETLYVAFGDSTYHIWSGNIEGDANFTEWCQVDGITKIAYVAGTLYGAKGSASADALLGTFTMTGAAPHAWTQYSPVELTASGYNVGLCSSGNSVYWTVQNGSRSFVYRAQVETSTFEEAASFPTGFIARCAYAYMGNVYVGGYYDGPEKSNGRGAIYVVTSMGPALLTTIGEPIGDWRVESISAYEKSLYFVSNGSVWRWDLVYGGYSHWASLAGQATNDSLSYDWTESMASEPANPGTWTKTVVGTGTAVADGVLTISCPIDADSVTYSRSHAGTSAAGSTLDIALPANVERSSFGFVKLDDSAQAANLYFRGYSKRTADYPYLKLYLDDATSSKREVATLDNLVSHTIRLTLRNGRARIYDGETLLYTTADIPAGAGKTISFGATCDTDFGSACTFVIDSLALDDDGAFDYESGATQDGTIACLRDCVWVAYPETSLMRIGHYTGNTKTESWETSGWIRHSRSTARMSTVNKQFVYADAILAEPLPSGATLKVQTNIDGSSIGTVTLEPVGESDIFFAAKLPSSGSTGREVQSTLLLTATGTSPKVTHFALRFSPMTSSTLLHTLIVDLVGNREDNDGRLYDCDSATLVLKLEALLNKIVEVEYMGMYFEGKVEATESRGYPATKNNASPISATLKLTVREIS